MDLSPLTPYSGRYAGYEIEKGKLSLNLSYRIEKRKLDAQNKVFIDQFTFGDPVESPHATKLPVRLAVSLLKDRKGEIHLDLPVTGQIDDPKFSVWRIVWKIIGNLLVKAATSPFALIGAMFGGGEELSYLEFDPGLSDIPAAGAGKLRNLAKALYERPALKLEIEGHADLERDPEALRQVAVPAQGRGAEGEGAGEGRAAGARRRQRARRSGGVPEKYLALAYKEEKFPKPRNFIGMAKELPAPEMEKLMMTHIQVTDGDLRQLAVERAARVRDALVAGRQGGAREGVPRGAEDARAGEKGETERQPRGFSDQIDADDKTSHSQEPTWPGPCLHEESPSSLRSRPFPVRHDEGGVPADPFRRARSGPSRRSTSA